MSKNKNIGVELSDGYINIVTIKSIQSNYEAKNYKSYKVPEIKNEKEYYNFVKKCITDFGKKTKTKFMNLHFSIPYDEENVHIKFLKLPTNQKKVIQKTLKYEIAEQEITTNIDDIYYNWEETSKEEESGSYNYILLTVRKKLIRYLSKIQSVKLKISNIEVHPISIGRLLFGNCAYIHMCKNETKLYIYIDGMLSQIETFEFNDKVINDKIHEYDTYITKDYLEDIKKELYIWDENVETENTEINNISKLVTKEYNSLVQDIKKIIRSFELKNSIILEQIYFSGKNSNLNYFNNLLTGELEVPSKKMQFLINENELSENQEDFSKYTIASSALLNEKFDYLKELNLKKYTKYQFDFLPILVGVIALSAIVNSGIYYINSNLIENVEELESIVSIQESKISEIVNKKTVILDSISSKEQKITTIQEVLNLQKWLSDILYILPDKTPKDLIITNIDTIPGRITLTGNAKNYSDIGFLAMELENYGNIEIGDIDNDISNELINVETGEVVSSETIGIIRPDDEDIEDEDEDKEIIEMTKGFTMIINYDLFTNRLNKFYNEVEITDEPIINEEKSDGN